MEVKNNSGYRPVGHAVLLRAIEIEEMQSLIHIPEEVQRSAASLDTQGIVVEIGADCWNGEKETPRAKLGDRVLVTKFSGGIIVGTDGLVYKMVPDHSIYAVRT